MKKQIEIGDIVEVTREVTSIGGIFTASSQMAKKLYPVSYVRNKFPASLRFKVVATGNHLSRGTPIYLLKNEEGEFLFDNENDSFKVISKGKKYKTSYVKVHNSEAIKAVMEGSEEYYTREGTVYRPLDMYSSLDQLCKAYKKDKQETMWQDEVAELVKIKGLSTSLNGTGHLRGLSWDNDEDFLEVCRLVCDLTENKQ